MLKLFIPLIFSAYTLVFDVANETSALNIEFGQSPKGILSGEPVFAFGTDVLIKATHEHDSAIITINEFEKKFDSIDKINLNDLIPLTSGAYTVEVKLDCTCKENPTKTFGFIVE